MRPHDRWCTSREALLWAESSTHWSGCNVRKAIALYCGLITHGADCVMSSAAGGKAAITARQVADSGCRQDLGEQALLCGFARCLQYGDVSISTAPPPESFAICGRAVSNLNAPRAKQPNATLTYHRKIIFCESMSGLYLRTLARTSPLAATSGFSR